MKRAEKATKGRASGKVLRGAVMALIGSSMLAAAGVAVAAKPVKGSATAPNACEAFDPATQELIQKACDENVRVAQQMVPESDAAYIGSCEGGGACADSVYNKLLSAASKFSAGKITDGCANLAAIQADLAWWNRGASKPKINDAGYKVISAAIQAIQTDKSCF